MSNVAYHHGDEYDDAAYEVDLLADEMDEEQAAMLQQRILQQQFMIQSLESIPLLVRNFIAYLHRMLAERRETPQQRAQQLSELQTLYEQTYPKLTEKYFQEEPWPAPEVISPLANNGMGALSMNDTSFLDELFLILYRELYFRHIYAKLQPTLENRFVSYENYCALFNLILSKIILDSFR